ncbi:MAG: hypothetical protein IPL75_14900 [Acidobacteria bacterium]|nr:hypothetical protein [Acidobacteriota bacterium]
MNTTGVLGGLLEIGLQQPLHVREERLSTRHDACRLLYVSDIHLRNGRTDRLCGQVVEAAQRSGPDLVLLGGDTVDRSTELGSLADSCAQAGRGGADALRSAAATAASAWTASAMRWCVAGQWITTPMHGWRMAGVIAIAGPEGAPPAEADVLPSAHTTRGSGNIPGTKVTTSSGWSTCMDSG